MIRTSEQIDQIAAAAAVAQLEVKTAIRESENPYFKSKYADLYAITKAAMPYFNKNGIFITQSPSNEAGSSIVGMVTRLTHKSGQWIEYGPIYSTAKDAGPQSIGSAITYLRRYQLAPATGVATEDDDGNAATGEPGPKPFPQPTVKASDLALRQASVWNKITERHGASEEDLARWIRDAINKPTRTKNKLGKWGFSEDEFKMMEARLEQEEQERNQDDNTLK